RLTAEEMTKMQEHCRVGSEILARFSSLQPVAQLIRSHHERFDGKGYPDALAGKELSVGAAIIAVVDAFDAMTTDRPYRKAMPIAAVLTLNAGAAQMGLLGAALLTPYLVFGLFAGVTVDRLRRRPILIAADVGRAALLAMIPVLAVTGRLRIEHLYAIGFLFGTLEVFFEVA